MTELSLDKLLDHFDKRFDGIKADFNSLRGELNGIRQDFNTFEAGRLTDLTSRIAILETKQKSDESSLIKTLGFEILKATVLAVVAGLLLLLFRSQM